MLRTPEIDEKFQQALRYHQAGFLSEAETIYDHLSRINPRDPELLHLRGVIAGQKGKHVRALTLLRQAIDQDPNVPEYHQNLGVAFERVGSLRQAAECYNMLGNLWQERNRFQEALTAYDKVLALEPRNGDARSNRGAALNRLGRHEESIAWFDEALRLQGDKPLPDTYLNLGNAYMGMGNFRKALSAYDQALVVDRDNALAHWDRGLLLLLQGRFEEGWKEYEWRWKWRGYTEPRNRFPQPIWKGEAPQEIGGPVLLVSEQGYGDTLQFSRYIPVLVEAGHDIVFEAPPEMLALMERNFAGPHVRVVPRPDNIATNPTANEKFVRYTGLMSLPAILNTTRKTIPSPGPYLTADPDLVAKWAPRFADAKGLKVGIAWAGRLTHVRDGERSISPAGLGGLKNISGVTFYSLQTGPASEQTLPIETMSLTDGLTNFGETAAAIANLDLVISADTAIVHLAAAMGKPTWVLLPQIPDWRWQHKGDTSDWYNSIRLFRQKLRGDWIEVIQRVKEALVETTTA